MTPVASAGCLRWASQLAPVLVAVAAVFVFRSGVLQSLDVFPLVVLLFFLSAQDPTRGRKRA